MEGIFTEILVELTKMENNKYRGIVIVHPEDFDNTVSFIISIINKNNTLSFEDNRYSTKTVIHSSGSSLIITDATKEYHTETRPWFYNLAPFRYDTILMVCDFNEKIVVDADYNTLSKPITNTNPSDAVG